MQNPTDRIAHTTAFVTPVVKVFSSYNVELFFSKCGSYGHQLCDVIHYDVATSSRRIYIHGPLDDHKHTKYTNSDIS